MRGYITKRNVLILLTALFFLIAWNRSINLLYGMFALLAALLILAHLLPRYSLQRVIASRLLPAAAFEGDNVKIIVDVKNTGLAGRSMIEVVDVFPAAEPSLQSPMTFIARLAALSTRHYSFTMPCYKRGEYQVGPITITSSYPLGISRARKSINGSVVPFLVYPQVFPIAHLPLMSGSVVPMSGVEAASKAGGSEEFFGTREYRQGDSLRYIHWPSTARHSTLIVKEFEIRASVEATIVIDLEKSSDIGQGKETTLEYAVRIAASIARYSLDRGHSVQLVGFGKTERIVPAAKGHSQIAFILETLAKVQADGTVPYARAVNRATEFMRDGATAVLIFSEARLREADMIYSFNLLKARRIQPLCVVLNNESFEVSGKANGAYLGHRIFVGDGIESFFISKGDNLTEVFSQ